MMTVVREFHREVARLPSRLVLLVFARDELEWRRRVNARYFTRRRANARSG
jgi:hypothetical protein